jgi:hypothetical protein
MFACGFYQMNTLVIGRTRRAVVVRLTAGAFGLAGACWLTFKIQEIRASDRAARAVRLALASGRHDQAAVPPAQWLEARPGSAEADALSARLALEQRDLERVTRELNQARALGYPERDLERLHAVSLTRIGRYDEAEPILVGLYQPETKPDPLVEEALARLYLMTCRPRQARSGVP